LTGILIPIIISTIDISIVDIIDAPITLHIPGQPLMLAAFQKGGLAVKKNIGKPGYRHDGN